MAQPPDPQTSAPAPGEPLCCVIAVGGLVASGKTTLARDLARRLGAAHVEADHERAALLGPAGDVHEAEAMRRFAPDVEARVYTALMHRAEPILARGHAAVLDGCFARAAQREAARALARRNGAPFVFVECVASEEATRRRLAKRDRRAEHPGWEWLHADLAARWERSDSLARDEQLRVETASPERAVAEVEERAAVWRRAPGPWPPPEAIQAVTFDCWSTLIYEADWESAHARRVAAVREAARAGGRETSQAEAASAFDQGWALHMSLWRDGVATGAREIAQSALTALGLTERSELLDPLVEHLQHASHSGRVAEVPGARETLESLSAAGVRCALVCDTGLTPGPVVRRQLDALGLLAPLAVQAFSDEVGFPKPDPRPFRAALAPLGIPPERAVHVGDLRRTDVAGARALGMRSVRIRAHHDDASNLPEADAVVASHAELRALLGHARR
jgi:FMN phosphatase YigB (HAD superfamily)/predicted kinase